MPRLPGGLSARNETGERQRLPPRVRVRRDAGRYPSRSSMAIARPPIAGMPGQRIGAMDREHRAVPDNAPGVDLSQGGAAPTGVDSSPMKLKQRSTLLAALAAAALTAACGPSSDQTASGDSADAGPEAAPKKGESSGDAKPAEREIVITANDDMKFNVDSFTVKPGRRVKLTLKNVGEMPKFSMGHNIVILEQGADGQKFVDKASNHADNDYIPPAMTDRIVAHTKLLGGGEQDSVVFTTPEKPGERPFVCSFPGHYQVGMKGVMNVRE